MSGSGVVGDAPRRPSLTVGPALDIKSARVKKGNRMSRMTFGICNGHFPHPNEKKGNDIQKYSSVRPYNPTHVMMCNRPERSMGTTPLNSQTNNTDCKIQAPSQEGVLRNSCQPTNPEWQQPTICMGVSDNVNCTLVCNSQTA